MSSTTAAGNTGIVLPDGVVMKLEDFDSLICRRRDWDDETAGEDKGPQTKRRKVAPEGTTSVIVPTKAKLAQASAAQVKVAKPQAPSDDITGEVPSGLVPLCATISNQIYTANKITDFNLSNPDDKTVMAEAIIFDNHDTLKDVIPPFCVSVSGNYLILAWRGSSTLMDWMSDFGAAPVSSSRWSEVSSAVKAHSGFTSLVESELAAHEGFLLKEIRNREIDTLLLTGHSLAGGMAQVAHLMIEGQLATKGSPWNLLTKPLKVKSISFAAPMTTLVTTANTEMDKLTRDFLTKIAEHSCNLVYGADIVPHCPGDIDYSVRAVTEVVYSNNVSRPWNAILRMFGIKGWVIGELEKLGKSELAMTMLQYQHLGRVIYYQADASNPKVLRDSEFLPELPTFRSNKDVTIQTKNSNSVAEQIKVDHSVLLESFAYKLEPASSLKTDSKVL